MVSIVIPAHNEAAVIRKTLTELTRGTTAGEFEIIVVCNGCTDETAQIATGFSEDVHVIETRVPSKTNALNLGDKAARFFPRIYLDADVRLNSSAVSKLERTLGASNIFAAAPRPRFDLSGCSSAVQAFYQVHERLPSSREGIGGSGVYAVNEVGRSRFGAFPAITADDGFVRIQFAEHERVTLEDCNSVVTAPKTIAALVNIKTRSHLGSYELQERFPGLWQNRGAKNSAALAWMVLNPAWWPKLAVYGYVKVVARLRARRKMRMGTSNVWERDETSRAHAAVIKSI